MKYQPENHQDVCRVGRTGRAGGRRGPKEECGHLAGEQMERWGAGERPRAKDRARRKLLPLTGQRGTYRAFLHDTVEHDHAPALLLPHHLPEVAARVGQGALQTVHKVSVSSGPGGLGSRRQCAVQGRHARGALPVLCHAPAGGEDR